MPLTISPRLDQPTLPEGQLLYAVGDIHGRLDLLERLLGLIERDATGRHADRRTLVFLGDYVDRGPDSRGVVERLISGCLKVRSKTIRSGSDRRRVAQDLNALTAAPDGSGSWRAPTQALPSHSGPVTPAL